MSQNDKIYDVNKSKYNKECLRMTRFMMLIKVNIIKNVLVTRNIKVK